MRRIVLASRNKKKAEELRRILTGLPFEIVTLGEYPDSPEVEEDGETFEANSEKKARVVSEATGQWALADDSGLEVEALGGEPGVYSARYGGLNSDEARNRYLLEKLRGVPREQRKARFVCCTTLHGDGRKIFQTTAVCEGVVLEEPRGDGGFGYDPLFQPRGYDRSMAELSPEEKNAVSHRGKALRAIRRFLLAGNEKE